MKGQQTDWKRLRMMSYDNTEKVWVVIPTHNRSDDLNECIESLLKAGISGEQIIVVDNASTDNTIEMIQESFSSVKIISLDENLGATGASNAGFDLALGQGADYILRLDSDTVVAPDFLPPLIEVAQSDPNIGVVSPKIYFHNQPNVIWYAGVDRQPLILGARNSHRNQQDSPENSQIRVVAYTWAAAMLIRREVLEKSKGFDTDFFVYHEEIDFCERITTLGYQLIFVPESFVWHKVGSVANSAWTAFHWNRSKMLLYRKHSKNIFHRILLIIYAFSYAVYDQMCFILHFRSKRGNRGPLTHALRGLWVGLTTDLSNKKRTA